MTVKERKYGVIEPDGKVKDKWFVENDLADLAEQNDLERDPKEGVPILVSQLEELGYVIISYGKICPRSRVPKESLYDDWKSIQMNE